jgi:glycosyltransferase involved in cell wall biosynthesis
MDSKKLVSVIIPCYNKGRYLNDTIQSVLNQTYCDFEIIIVDDGSTDTITKHFLSQLNHPNIKVFFKGHEGVSSTRNFGIEHSNGAFILPLDADDLITSDYLEMGFKVLSENPSVKLVTCNVEYFGYGKGKIVFPQYSIERLLARNLFVISSMFRRTDFFETSGFNPNMKEGFEDWDFWISLLKTGGEVFRIEKRCFFYRINKRSRNNQLKEKCFSRLRNQIYENHKELYHQYYFDPTVAFEYMLIRDSLEYRVGKMVTRPFRYLQRIFHG